MKDTTYKGYTAKIEYSPADGCLIGRLLGIQDFIAFHGDSVTEIRKAFEEAVDDYLALCARIGQSPQKPFSGKIMLRVAPEDHVKLAIQAQARSTSINALAIDALHNSGTLEH
jgi:predicted HicB family RNase H-like nuclease